MLGEVIRTAGPNHIACCDSYNFMAKFNLSSSLSIPIEELGKNKNSDVCLADLLYAYIQVY